MGINFKEFTQTGDTDILQNYAKPYSPVVSGMAGVGAIAYSMPPPWSQALASCSKWAFFYPQIKETHTLSPLTEQLQPGNSPLPASNVCLPTASGGPCLLSPV